MYEGKVGFAPSHPLIPSHSIGAQRPILLHEPVRCNPKRHGYIQRFFDAVLGQGKYDIGQFNQGGRHTRDLVAEDQRHRKVVSFDALHADGPVSSFEGNNPRSFALQYVEEYERILVATPWDGVLRPERSFAHPAMLRCGREASQVHVQQPSGIRRAEDRADVMGRADVVRDDGDGVGRRGKGKG